MKFYVRFEVTGDSTRSTLFAPRTLTKMEQGDRVRYVEREFMTNTTLRERFGIDTKNSATASRLIKEAMVAGAICRTGPEFACWVLDEFKNSPRNSKKNPYKSIA